MKKYIALIVAALSTLSIWAHVDYELRTPDNYIPIEVSNDTSIVLIKYSPDNDVYDRLLIYRAQYDGVANINLKGLAEVKHRGYSDSHFTKNIPQDAVIVDAYTDHPRITGRFDGQISPTNNASGIIYEMWQIAQSVSDYDKHPEAYPADTLANMSNSAYALINSYKERIAQVQHEQIVTDKAITKKKERTAGWVMSLLLIPLIACIVLGAITNNNKISNNFSKKIRAIAITEMVSLVAAVGVIFLFMDAAWWMITLAVLTIIVFLIYYIFFGLFTYDHIKQSVPTKMPWLQIIVFGLLSLLVPYAVLGIIVGIKALFTGAALTGNDLAGFISAIVLLGIFFLTGLWYKSALAKRMPSLNGDFWPIAVVTGFTFLAVLCLIFVIIAICIWKGVFKMGIQEMINGGASDGVRSASGIESCTNCARLGSDCPHFREMGSPTQVCSYHRYRP